MGITMRPDVREAVAEIRGRIEAAAARSGRAATSVTLIGVTKRVDLADVRLAAASGLLDLGENYVQSANERYTVLRPEFPDLRLHMIGALQRNKARAAVALFDCIQTVDSLKLAQELEKEAARFGKVQNILLQVNIAADPNKSGCLPEHALQLVEELLECKHIHCQGLMTIGAFACSADERRQEFIALRTLRDELSATLSLPLPELSMGMSDDFEIAIEEGATMVRVGSALFGERM